MISPSDFCQWSSTDTEKRKPVINEVVLERYLTQQGFRCMYEDAIQAEMRVVRVVDKRIRKSGTNEIYRYLVDILEDSHEQWLQPLKAYRVLLYDPTIKQMVRVEPNILKDTALTSYIPFDNGIIAVNKSGIELKKYSDVLIGDTCILNEQIIHRDIDLGVAEYQNGAWYKFCVNAVGIDGITHLMRALGFMLHTYKDRANAKMVIFADTSLSEFQEANGGSGKSFIAYDSLREIRNSHYIDGKDFDPKSQFKFQGVKPEHDIVCIDDIPKGFKQTIIYNKITGNFSSEAKYKASKTLEFKDSAKFIITGNYGLVIEGESDRRRSCVIGFTDHYSSKLRPIDEFKHRFFDEWTDERAIEYQYFFGFMFSCIQLYLQSGMESYRHSEVMQKGVVNTHSNKLIAAINSAMPKLIGIENAMLQKEWKDVVGAKDENTLEVLRKVMDSHNYVIEPTGKKRHNGSEPVTLYYWRKR